MNKWIHKKCIIISTNTAEMCKWWKTYWKKSQIDGLVQDCNNSIANTLDLLQSCTKPSKCYKETWIYFYPSTDSWEPDLVTILPADGLAPDGARPSAGTMLTEKSDMYSWVILQVPLTILQDISALRSLRMVSLGDDTLVSRYINTSPWPYPFADSQTPRFV